MSNNIGKNIQTLAIVTVTISIVICVIFGLMLMSAGNTLYGDGSGVLLGMFLIIFGIFAAVVEAFLLYGFGELITSTKNIESMMLQQQLPQTTKPVGSSMVSTQPEPVQLERMPYYNNIQANHEKNTQASTVTAPPPVPQKTVKCANCGQENPSFEVNCQKCGQPLV